MLWQLCKCSLPAFIDILALPAVYYPYKICAKGCLSRENAVDKRAPTAVYPNEVCLKTGKEGLSYIYFKIARYIISSL